MLILYSFWAFLEGEVAPMLWELFNLSLFLRISTIFFKKNSEKTWAKNQFLPFLFSTLLLRTPTPAVILSNCFIMDIAVGPDCFEALRWHSSRSQNVQRQLNRKVDWTRSSGNVQSPRRAFWIGFQNLNVNFFSRFLTFTVYMRIAVEFINFHYKPCNQNFVLIIKSSLISLKCPHYENFCVHHFAWCNNNDMLTEK